MGKEKKKPNERKPKEKKSKWTDLKLGDIITNGKHSNNRLN